MLDMRRNFSTAASWLWRRRVMGSKQRGVGTARRRVDSLAQAAISEGLCLRLMLDAA